MSRLQFIKKKEFQFLSIIPIVICAYWVVFYGEFISDDWPMIAENPYLRSSDSLSAFFTTGVWRNSSLQIKSAALYRPMYLIWYYSIYNLAGPNPFWFHFALLMVHVVNSLFVYKIIKTVWLDRSQSASILGALFFALHPAQTQAIGWVSGGTDAVMLLFLLASFLLYVRFRHTSQNILFTFSMILFFVSLLTKETAAVYPALLVLYDLWQRVKFRHLISKRHGISFAILLIYLFLRARIVEGTGLHFSYKGLFRIFEQIFLTIRYLFIPSSQPFYFNYPEGGIAEPLDFAIGLFGIIIISVLFVRYRQFRFGIVWILLTMMPTLLLAFHSSGVFALRFLYSTVVGMAIVLSCLFDFWVNQKPVLVKTASLIIIGIFFTVTIVALPDWSKEKRFYMKVVESNTKSLSGYEGLATHYKRKRDSENVISTYILGLRNVTSDDERISLTENLAQYYADIGRFSESLATFHELNRLSPGTRSLLGIGNNLYMLGKAEDALPFYKKAILIDPQNSLLLANFALVNGSLGRVDEAIKYYKKVLDLPVDKIDAAAAIQAKNYLSGRK